MPLSTLFRAGLPHYIEEEKDQRNLWLFLHIPKTAGTSFRQELANRLKPQRNINIGKDDRDVPAPQKMDDAVTRFLDDPALGRIRFASGHMDMEHILRIRRARPGTKIITMLRDPVARLYSDFRYARTPQHPPYRAFIARYPTLMDYIQSAESSNKMFKRLAPDGVREVPELIGFLNDNLANIGTLETYNKSFYLLSTLLGDASLPRIYERKTAATEENDTPLTDEHRALIIERNHLDLALYAYYQQRLSTLDVQLPAAPAAQSA